MSDLKPTDFGWVCNECGLINFTSSVSQDEIKQGLHSCINCASVDFHKEQINIMKPTDKEYIEALALKKLPLLSNSVKTEKRSRINKRNGLIEGYQLALEHTNHAEVLEAIKKALLPEYIECDGAICTGCYKDILREAIQKSESNKLNK